MGDINKLHTHTLDKAEYLKLVMRIAPQGTAILDAMPISMNIGGLPAGNREVPAVAFITPFEIATKLPSIEIKPLVIAEGDAVGIDWVIAQNEFSP